MINPHLTNSQNYSVQNPTLQKYIASRGLASRRQAEQWIKEGRVTIDGSPAKPGDRVGKTQSVCIDGKPITESSPTAADARLLIYHKPVGEICTRHDPKNRKTPFLRLPPLKKGKWIMIGRLDLQTSGLLLFTNYGELANALMHPSSNIERHYLVRVLGNADEALLKRIQKGVRVDDYEARFKRVQFIGGKGANRWYRVVLTEGRNHEVRRIWHSQGLVVTRLMRVQYGDIILPKELKPAEFQEIKGKPLRLLMEKYIISN